MEVNIQWIQWIQGILSITDGWTKFNLKILSLCFLLSLCDNILISYTSGCRFEYVTNMFWFQRIPWKHLKRLNYSLPFRSTLLALHYEQQHSLSKNLKSKTSNYFTNLFEFSVIHKIGNIWLFAQYLMELNCKQLTENLDILWCILNKIEVTDHSIWAIQKCQLCVIWENSNGSNGTVVAFSAFPFYEARNL